MKKWMGLCLGLVVLGLISGCAVKQKYREAGVKDALTDWPEYTQDKDIQWNLEGNKGIGVRGYFYPQPGKMEIEIETSKEVIKPQAPERPVAVARPAPIVRKAEPTPVAKKKEGEKEWCPKKARTVIPQESKIMVADFDSGKKPNNMGYDFGAWTRDPADYTQTCMESFTRVTRDGTGYSLQIYYDVDSPVSAYNGFWCKLDGDIDYSVFKKVGFWVKGDTDRGYTKVFKVELKNCINETAIFYVTTVTDEWQHIVIPFEKFRGLTEWSLLKEFVITFEDRMATRKEGAIYVDDIYFEK
jgi:hypothetical protein